MITDEPSQEQQAFIAAHAPSPPRPESLTCPVLSTRAMLFHVNTEFEEEHGLMFKINAIPSSYKCLEFSTEADCPQDIGFNFIS